MSTAIILTCALRRYDQQKSRELPTEEILLGKMMFVFPKLRSPPILLRSPLWTEIAGIKHRRNFFPGKTMLPDSPQIPLGWKKSSDTAENILPVRIFRGRDALRFPHRVHIGGICRGRGALRSPQVLLGWWNFDDLIADSIILVRIFRGRDALRFPHRVHIRGSVVGEAPWDLHFQSRFPHTGSFRDFLCLCCVTSAVPISQFLLFSFSNWPLCVLLCKENGVWWRKIRQWTDDNERPLARWSLSSASGYRQLIYHFKRWYPWSL